MGNKPRYKNQYITEVLGDTRHSTLRNKLIFALGRDENARRLTDLLTYLITIQREQWKKNPDQMSEYEGYFLRNCNQIEQEVFLSSTHRRDVMNELKEKGLIDFTIKGREKIYRVKVLIDKVIDLVEDYDDEFNRYQDEFRESESLRCESKKDKQLENRKKWETINRWKYSDYETFREKVSEYEDIDEFDLNIITLISKAMWKYKKKKIEWTEKDLNYLRSVICEGRRLDKKEDEDRFYYKSKKEQEELFRRLGNNYKRIVDTCKLDDSKYKEIKSWAYSYSLLFNNNQTDEKGKPYRYNFEWKIDDIEYFKQDISGEISQN